MKPTLDIVMETKLLFNNFENYKLKPIGLTPISKLIRTLLPKAITVSEDLDFKLHTKLHATKLIELLPNYSGTQTHEHIIFILENYESGVNVNDWFILNSIATVLKNTEARQYCEDILFKLISQFLVQKWYNQGSTPKTKPRKIN